MILGNLYILTLYRIYEKTLNNKGKGKENEILPNPLITPITNISVDLTQPTISPKKNKDKRLKEKSILSSIFISNNTEDIDTQYDLEAEINKYFREARKPFDVSYFIIFIIIYYKQYTN